MISRLATATAFFIALALPSTAIAAYGNAADGVGGAQLVSADYARLEQGDDTTRFAAISGDGRYVAIETLSRNLFADGDPDPPGQFRTGGIFRFDLQTRALEKVADGSLMNDVSKELVRRGAANPSISADGRYVAFATAQPLVAADTNDNVDVYVRDMAVPAQVGGGACAPGPPCAFELASARDGGDVPASYGPAQFPLPGSNPGADVSRGVAISADGRRVAFRTEAPSDLPASASSDVPAGQIFLRDLEAKTTTLVTRTDPGGLPAGGALGAALSADGTTVAWTGSHAPEQTRFLEGENTDPNFLYYLWRRVADGPAAPTRRITGASDPDDPACPTGPTVFNQTSTGPCFGPLTDPESLRTSVASQLPALSADGRTVAFVTGAGPRPNATSGTGLDLFVTSMASGLSRKQATVELTRDPANFDPATSAPIGSIALAAGGRYLALTTVRTNFSLPALRLIGDTRPVPNVRELFVVDLQDRTLERISRSTTGGDVDGDVQTGVTISADGTSVAFSSFAGNLFRGDANQRADTFVATRLPEADPGPIGGANGPTETSIQTQRRAPRLLVKAKSKPNGIVILTISVPAAGSIDATATARVGNPPRPRVIATRQTRARGKGSLDLVMRPAVKFRPLLDGGRKLRARIRVHFNPTAGGKRLRASTAAAFAEG